MRALAIAAALLLWPALAVAQPTCYPLTGDPLASMGAVRLHQDGAYWTWYCWTADKWVGHGRVFHRTDVPRLTTIDIGARGKQYIETPESGRAALAAQWDTEKDIPCTQMIGNAGYASTLCGAMIAHLNANFPTTPPALPAPGVWRVAPNSTYTTRPTYLWSNGTRSTVAAPERVAVGSECNQAIGAGDYRGVLGRTDRVALCRKQ